MINNSRKVISVAFDATELGSFGKTGSGGIKRVIENTAEFLAADARIDLRLCGLNPNETDLVSKKLANSSGSSILPVGALHFETASNSFQAFSRSITKSNTVSNKAIRNAAFTVSEFAHKLSSRIPTKLPRDVQIFHSPFYPIPPALNRSSKISKFITVYDLIPITNPNFASPFFIELSKKVMKSLCSDTWVACISKAVKDDVCDYTKLSPERIFVTPLAASNSIFKQIQNDNAARAIRRKYNIPDAPYFLSLGAMDARKNVDHLIKCFSKVIMQREVNDLHLVLVGNRHAAIEIMKRFKENKGVLKRIIFPGFIEDCDLAYIYSGAMAFAFPSQAEGFGLPPLEAMQCGLPVISSNTTSMPEVIGNAGILLAPDDQDGWCEAILKLYGNAGLRAEMSTRSLERAKFFTWKKTVNTLIEGYNVSLG